MRRATQNPEPIQATMSDADRHTEFFIRQHVMKHEADQKALKQGNTPAQPNGSEKPPIQAKGKDGQQPLSLQWVDRDQARSVFGTCPLFFIAKSDD